MIYELIHEEGSVSFESDVPILPGDSISSFHPMIQGVVNHRHFSIVDGNLQKAILVLRQKEEG